MFMQQRKQKNCSTGYIHYENVELPDRVCLILPYRSMFGPCVNEVQQETYKEMIDEITKFLNGGIKK